MKYQVMQFLVEVEWANMFSKYNLQRKSTKTISGMSCFCVSKQLQSLHWPSSVTVCRLWATITLDIQNTDRVLQTYECIKHVLFVDVWKHLPRNQEALDWGWHFTKCLFQRSAILSAIKIRTFISGITSIKLHVSILIMEKLPGCLSITLCILITQTFLC